MNFADSIKKNFTSNYVDFSGRASRSEFWWFALFYAIAGVIAQVMDAVFFGVSGNKFFQFICALAFFLPFSGLAWRRMADVGLPGWISLIYIIFSAFYILILVGSITTGQPFSGDEELVIFFIFLLISAPFIVIWCLPSKVTNE